MFLFNLENLIFWDVDEGGLEKNIFIIERRIEAQSFVGNVNFSRYNNIARVSAIKLIQQLFVLSHGNFFLFNEPFLCVVFEFGFEFRFEG